ncbi:MAG TPA: hypothetical protein VFD43_05935 [Planctomycetota bacterium]|nr:hypothetical protein [Planctomycetota bacterium]
MKQSIGRHAVSAVVSGVTGIVVLAALGMSPPGKGGGGGGGGNPNLGAMDVRVLPSGADMLQIVHPDEYTVPSGKVLVLTAVNTYDLQMFFPGGAAKVSFDGVDVFFANAFQQATVEIPTGLAAAAGTRVSLEVDPVFANQGGTILGYLEDT